MNVLLTHYGITVPKDNIVSSQFLVRSVKTSTLVRDTFDPTGIYYTEAESIQVMLRIYFRNELLRSIFAFAGIEVLEMVEASEDEEDAEAVVEKGEVFYIEYAISSNTLETRKDAIINHPTFIRMYNASEKNASVLDRKISSYNEMLTMLSSMGAFEPEEMDDMEEDAANLGGPRLSSNAISAQANAHRTQQEAVRDRMRKIFDFFEERIIKSGVEETDLAFSEAREQYKDVLVNDEPILSEEVLIADMNEEIREI